MCRFYLCGAGPLAAAVAFVRVCKFARQRAHVLKTVRVKVQRRRRVHKGSFFFDATAAASSSRSASRFHHSRPRYLTRGRGILSRARRT